MAKTVLNKTSFSKEVDGHLINFELNKEDQSWYVWTMIDAYKFEMQGGFEFFEHSSCFKQVLCKTRLEEIKFILNEFDTTLKKETEFTYILEIDHMTHYNTIYKLVLKSNEIKDYKYENENLEKIIKLLKAENFNLKSKYAKLFKENEESFIIQEFRRLKTMYNNLLDAHKKYKESQPKTVEEFIELSQWQYASLKL